jgi:hypothetical protein
MLKRLLFIKRRPDLTHEQFRDYYEHVHVPLVSSLRLVQPLVYRRNYIMAEDAIADALMSGRDDSATSPYDCVTEVVFRNRDDAAPPSAQTIELLREDEMNFIAPAGLSIHVVETLDAF